MASSYRFEEIVYIRLIEALKRVMYLMLRSSVVFVMM